jgi:hypothetical protein
MHVYQRQEQNESQSWHGIFQTVVNGQIPVANTANRTVISGWVDESRGETTKVIGPRWFRQCLQDSPELIQKLVWTSADVLDPKKRTQIEQNALAESRKVFSDTARRLKAFGDSTANFQFTCSILGNTSFNSYELETAWLAGALQGLSSPGAEELEQWKQEQIEQENSVLKADTVTPHQLQKQKEIRQRRSAELRRSAVEEELHRRLVLGYERDIKNGNKFYPLPLDWKGSALDSAYIKRCDLQTMKVLVARFGDAQLTDRLHGIHHASALLDRGDGKGPVLVEVEFL